MKIFALIVFASVTAVTGNAFAIDENLSDDIEKVFFSVGYGPSYFADSSVLVKRKSENMARDEAFMKAEQKCGGYRVKVLGLSCERALVSLPISASVPALHEGQCHIKYQCE
mgnify:CR=1 FL=1